jgi:hypothetical protein
MAVFVMADEGGRFPMGAILWRRVDTLQERA